MASPKSQLWDYRCVKYTASHLRDLHFLSLHQLIWTVSFLCPWHLSYCLDSSPTESPRAYSVPLIGDH